MVRPRCCVFHVLEHFGIDLKIASMALDVCVIECLHIWANVWTSQSDCVQSQNMEETVHAAPVGATESRCRYREDRQWSGLNLEPTVCTGFESE